MVLKSIKMIRLLIIYAFQKLIKAYELIILQNITSAQVAVLASLQISIRLRLQILPVVLETLLLKLLTK